MKEPQKTLKEYRKLPFEDALKKLEATVEEMESGNLPLDKMIQCFEKGSTLASVCGEKLKEIEKKIEVLVKEEPDGGEWEEFDASSPRHTPEIDDDEEIVDDSSDEDSENDNEPTLF